MPDKGGELIPYFHCKKAHKEQTQNQAQDILLLEKSAQFLLVNELKQIKGIKRQRADENKRRPEDEKS